MESEGGRTLAFLPGNGLLAGPSHRPKAGPNNFFFVSGPRGGGVDQLSILLMSCHFAKRFDVWHDSCAFATIGLGEKKMCHRSQNTARMPKKSLMPMQHCECFENAQWPYKNFNATETQSNLTSVRVPVHTRLHMCARAWESVWMCTGCM